MSRTIAGRTNLASRSAPVFIPRPLSAAAAGAPCLCGMGPIANPSNPLSGTFGNFQVGFLGGSYGPGATSCPDVLDQRVELTFADTWGTTAGDWAMWVRRHSGGHVGGDHYSYFVYGHSNSPFTHETQTLSAAVIGSGDIVLDAGTFLGDLRPQAGDVFELSAIGSAITFKVNGATRLSAVDSSVVHPPGTSCDMGTGGDAYDSLGAAVSLDLVTEDYCP